MERIAEPASRFHSDYLAYRQGDITRAESVARLPHIAMIGDSVCMNIYISSPWGTFWRARTSRRNNWFLDPDPAPGIYSVSKALEAITPFVAIECAGVGALVDHQHGRQGLFRRILGTRNFSAQVAELLRARRFPDLILIWIGHNNVDWAWRCPPDDLERPEKRLPRLSKHFREDYTRQIRRLIARARIERHRVAIVVYGLVDFESFFKARAIAEGLREKNPKLYPYLGTDLKYFISMQPAYRGNLIRLVRMINEELHAMARQMEHEIEHVPNVQVRYSDALAKTDLSRVEVIHAIDGWHPSVEGHNVFA